MANNNGGMNRQGPRCSFCGKSQNMVERLVAGPNVYICNECIALCNDILKDEEFMDADGGVKQPEMKKLPLPSDAGSHGKRQNLSGADPGPDPGGALCHCRRDERDGSRLCGR